MHRSARCVVALTFALLTGLAPVAPASAAEPVDLPGSPVPQVIGKDPVNSPQNLPRWWCTKFPDWCW